MNLSYGERIYTKAGVEDNVRNDGRSRLDYRHFVVETGTVPSASGSARVRLDATDVLVAVKAEIGEPDLNTPDQGKIVLAVACSNSLSMHVDNSAAGAMEVKYSNQLSSLLLDSGAINLHDLNIIAGRQVWVLYIDALIQDSDGNLLDVLSLAVKAALHNTTIPAVTVIQGDSPEDLELELSEDPADVISLSKWDKVPVFVSVAKIGNHFVVDSTMSEEHCMSTQLCVAVNPQGTICGTTKTGPGSIAPPTLFEMIRCAKSVGMDLIKKLIKQMNAEQNAENEEEGEGGDVI